MANKQMKRDLSRYNKLGLLLDELCVVKGWSFHKLAQESATPKASIIRASRAQPGAFQARRATVLKWSQALGCDKETTDRLFHLAGHATEEEMGGQEETGPEKDSEA
jgi:hypothetical protein